MFCTRKWRRERDSNPRSPFGLSGFQDRLFQPLTHPSAGRTVCSAMIVRRLHRGSNLCRGTFDLQRQSVALSISQASTRTRINPRSVLRSPRALRSCSLSMSSCNPELCSTKAVSGNSPHSCRRRRIEMREQLATKSVAGLQETNARDSGSLLGPGASQQVIICPPFVTNRLRSSALWLAPRPRWSSAKS